MKNYENSLKASTLIAKMKPDHFMACKRTAMCFYHLKNLEECIEWAEKSLKLKNTDKELIKLLDNALLEISDWHWTRDDINKGLSFWKNIWERAKNPIDIQVANIWSWPMTSFSYLDLRSNIFSDYIFNPNP